jgi:hypothetical protein
VALLIFILQKTKASKEETVRGLAYLHFAKNESKQRRNGTWRSYFHFVKIKNSRKKNAGCRLCNFSG